jgi:hypothetical protein
MFPNRVALGLREKTAMRMRRIGPREPHYLGYRDEQGRARVFRIGHSPVLYELLLPVSAANDAKGFDWGNTAASAQLLSLAILADYLSDDELALRLTRPFTETAISNLPAGRPWQLVLGDKETALRKLVPEAA